MRIYDLLSEKSNIQEETKVELSAEQLYEQRLQKEMAKHANTKEQE
jgi:hypothetical protein